MKPPLQSRRPRDPPPLEINFVHDGRTKDKRRAAVAAKYDFVVLIVVQQRVNLRSSTILLVWSRTMVQLSVRAVRFRVIVSSLVRNGNGLEK
jgi:hypothetical protein